MRRAPLVLLVLVVVPLCAVAVTRAAAIGTQEGTPTATAAGVVGVWRVTIAPPAGPPHAGLVTFAADGTLRAATQPVQPAPPGAPFATVVFSEGHGVWETSGDEATFTLDFVAASESGMPVGTSTLRGRAMLGPDGQTLSAIYTLTLTAPDGAAVDAGQGSFQGSRMTVEPPATPVGATPTAGTPAA